MKRTGAQIAVSRLFATIRAAVPAALVFALVSASNASAATLSVVVLKNDGKPLSGVVITAEPQAVRAPVAPPTVAVVDQVDLAFKPDVSIVPVGSSVAFPNSDAVSHQVYSFSATRRFQLPMYRGKPYPPVVFEQPGIVTLGCNIHDNMLAYVVVTDSPYFGRADSKGAWSVANVPDGAYRIRLWHPLLKDASVMVERAVQIGSEPITIKLTEALRPPPLKGHPHSWDY